MLPCLYSLMVRDPKGTPHRGPHLEGDENEEGEFGNGHDRASDDDSGQHEIDPGHSGAE